MSATPRDLLKTRPQRIGEVYTHLHHKSGQFNAQIVAFGGDLVVGAPTTTFTLRALEGVINQAIANVAELANQAVPAGAATTAGQDRKVLVEVTAAGVLSTKVGAVSTTGQADAVLPKGDANKLSVGWLELPASFTPGTTALTAAMLKKMPYWS